MAPDRTRAALAAVVAAVLLAQVLLYPGVDLLVAAFGAGAPLGASTWFLAAEFAAFVAFAAVWGAASDAAGRRVPFIAAGAAGGAVGYLALAGLARIDAAFGVVLLVRVLQGAATIGAFSLSMTMLLDLEGGSGRNMGAAGLAVGVGTAAGAPLGGWLYEAGPLVPLYAAAGVLLAVGALVALVPDRAANARAEPDAGPGGGHGVGTLRAAAARLRATPALAVPYAFGLIDRLTAGFFALVGSLYFREVFGLSPAATGLTLALFFAPFALLQYPFGALSDRVGRTAPIVVGSVTYGVAVALVGLAPTVPLARGAMVLVGVLGALMAPATMALVGDLAPAADRGVAMAGFNAAGSVGFLAGIVLGGSVAAAAGYTAAFLAAGALEVGIALLAVPALLRLRPDDGAGGAGGAGGNDGADDPSSPR